MSAELQRDLGRAEGRLTALERDIRETKDRLAKIEETIDRIDRVLSEAKGGWKVLMLAGSIGAALMAGLLKVVPFLPIGR
jgi:septal ring factor EnvC (AmiA/AmiB activator)